MCVREGIRPDEQTVEEEKLTPSGAQCEVDTPSFLSSSTLLEPLRWFEKDETGRQGGAE